MGHRCHHRCTSRCLKGVMLMACWCGMISHFEISLVIDEFEVVSCQCPNKVSLKSPATFESVRGYRCSNNDPCILNPHRYINVCMFERVFLHIFAKLWQPWTPDLATVLMLNPWRGSIAVYWRVNLVGTGTPTTLVLFDISPVQLAAV